MSRSSLLILLGGLTVLIPFSGLPSAFRTLFLVIAGATVFGLGIAERARIAHEARTRVERPVAESLPVEIPHGVSPI